MRSQEFVARQKRVTIDTGAHQPVDIAYTDIGHGPTMIMMHGIPTWSFLYHDVLDRLAEQHRVIAPDFIGHGYSDQRDHFDRSLVAQRNMILALMDELSIKRATLIGHDTGGGVALMMGIENPERVERVARSRDNDKRSKRIFLGKKVLRSSEKSPRCSGEAEPTGRAELSEDLDAQNNGEKPRWLDHLGGVLFCGFANDLSRVIDQAERDFTSAHFENCL